MLCSLATVWSKITINLKHNTNNGSEYTVMLCVDTISVYIIHM